MDTEMLDLFRGSSLRILRPSSIDLLSQQLNPRKLLYTDEGKLRDYRGLAEIAGLSSSQMQRVENERDHFKKLIMIWIVNPGVTIADLVSALARMNRFDVIDDVTEKLKEDCIFARRQGLGTLESQSVALNENVLTLQDLEAVSNKRKLPTYHAMVMYAQDYTDDEAFGLHLVDRLEAAGLSVFLPSRDLIAGTIEHSASEKIIARRCQRVVIVFTPALLASKDKEFLIELAQYVGIERRRAMLVPVMYKWCAELPESIKMLTKMKYEYSETVNFYDKLLKGVFKVPQLPAELREYPPELLGRFDSPEPAAIGLPGAASGDDDFANLATMSSVASAELYTTSTTVSQLSTSSQAELLNRLPEVPLDEPRSKGSKSSPYKKKLKSLLKRKSKKSKDYEPA